MPFPLRGGFTAIGPMETTPSLTAAQIEPTISLESASRATYVLLVSSSRRVTADREGILRINAENVRVSVATATSTFLLGGIPRAVLKLYARVPRLHLVCVVHDPQDDWEILRFGFSTDTYNAVRYEASTIGYP